jgi:putative nucleotidyltransferase with HDIG domain
MLNWVARLREGDEGQSQRALSVSLATLGAVLFVAVATFIIAFNDILERDDTAGLRVGGIAASDVRAPASITYISEVLTSRAQREAANAITPVYDPPDPSVSRQQLQLLGQILDYIENVRADPYGTIPQKIADLDAITALTLDESVMRVILELDEENWRAVDDEAELVLERVMRESIRESDLSLIRDQLPTQVSVRFSPRSAAIVVALVEDLIRPNRLPNPEATEAARQTAIANTPTQSRSFERGQIVVRAGTRVDELDYEALQKLGLLQAPDRRLELIGRGMLASLLVLVATGLYIGRRMRGLFTRGRFLALLATIFLGVLAGARVFWSGDQIYVFPTAALALLFVALTGPELALFGSVGLGLLIGVMAGNSLEIMALVAFGGCIGALSMRRSERLNSYFIAGAIIAVANAVVVIMFNLNLLGSEEAIRLSELIVLSMANGLFSAFAALAGIYMFTLVFNLPTSLKLMELNQPNQPLLQRLLREAPGTYQHSLQVANLSEQAANAIGANAEMVRVAALYHDVGKILNPMFFVENQAENVNPHDGLNDPYRSADIIIGHVTDGEKLARQYRLPARIRDFIIEHHGTTMVSYFYNRAVEQAGDAEAVDVEQFTYPGPRPQSRETAILMLADSCESTVRARKPANKNEIAEIVQQIMDARTRDGQLDDSGLTLSNLKTIRTIFVDMLQAVFHPRINYPAAGEGRAPRIAPETAAGVRSEIADTSYLPARADGAAETPPEAQDTPAESVAIRLYTQDLTPIRDESEIEDDDDDRPLQDVPPLRRTQRTNGVSSTQEMKPVEGEPDDRDRNPE